MTSTKTTKVKGMYNSSLTRVRPFFQRLFEVDRTGRQWLPLLLKAMPLNKALSEKLSKSEATILHKKGQNYESILDECLEHEIPPSKRFLEWALQNPHLLIWPDKGKKTYGKNTQIKREHLFGFHGEELKTTTMKEGLTLLEEAGTRGSSQKWWAFEGFTHMDCFIETDKYLLGIEGKRTDKVSASTEWFKCRNQVVRNLEVLAELAKEKGKEYAFMLLTEEGKDPMTKDHFVMSLPHNEHLVDELYAHYLGSLKWTDACIATNIGTECLFAKSQMLV